MELLALPTCVIEYELVDLRPAWAGPVETVVFQHGVGTDLGIWSQWLPALAGHYRLLRFSLRGFGGSRLAAGAPAPTLGQFAQDLLALADATQTGRFHLVAESFGGMAALHAASAAPERIASLCLLSTPHRGADIRPVGQWPAMTTSPQGMARWSDEMMAGRFAPGAAPPEALHWFRRTQDRTDPHWLGQLARLILESDLSGLLPRLQVPALLMVGDTSPYVGLSQVAALHALLPRSQVCIFPGARHGIAFSHARACAERFLAFAAGRSGTTQNEETP